jgi:hypothetical protein
VTLAVRAKWGWRGVEGAGVEARKTGFNLWEAPLAALRLIESSGPSGIRVARVQPIFNQAADCFPEIYDGYTFSQWLEFLEETGFIVWSGDKAKLTPEGQAFLTYRFVTDTMVPS